MAALGWTKGGNRRTTAAGMTDAPAAIRTGWINSCLSLVSGCRQAIYSISLFYTEKNKINVLKSFNQHTN